MRPSNDVPFDLKTDNGSDLGGDSQATAPARPPNNWPPGSNASASAWRNATSTEPWSCSPTTATGVTWCCSAGT